MTGKTLSGTAPGTWGRMLVTLVVCLLAISFHSPVFGSQEASPGQEASSTGDVLEGDSEPFKTVEVQLHDLELLTQAGKQVRFRSDVISDKLVVMNFFYTSCTTICPIYNAIFSQLQPLLGERLGTEVLLVSVTLDPATDIPPRVRREALKHKAEPGWVWLTGTKQNVDQVLRGLQAYFPDFTQHPPMALVGDGKTGTWKRINGFPRPEQILELIDALKEARGDQKN